jgi:hypothetical protein
MPQGLAHHVELRALADVVGGKGMAQRVGRRAGMPASARYFTTMVRIERVSSGFSNLVRKNASSSSIFGRTAR